MSISKYLRRIKSFRNDSKIHIFQRCVLECMDDNDLTIVIN